MTVFFTNHFVNIRMECPRALIGKYSISSTTTRTLRKSLERCIRCSLLIAVRNNIST
jgi:hypothetical protein